MLSGKIRRRNITYLPISTLTVNKELQNINQNSIDECLGEDTRIFEPGTPINSFSTNSSDLEKGILDLGIKISGLSSSSSLSWSEEYDAEISRKVQNELEKLDLIFRGLENVSSPYDMNEIAEWRNYFPNLYILGHNTPTNSANTSDASSLSEDEQSAELHLQNNLEQKHKMFPRNRSALLNKKLATQHASNSIKHFNSLPRKPRSLEIEQYLKISSIKSPDSRKRQSQNARPVLIKQKSKECSRDVSPEYVSLPFIIATPLKTQMRKRNERNKPLNKSLILPPIDTTFRSISATPRQASSKSLYVPLNFERNCNNKASQAARLKSDLMKLFDHIPVSNR